MCGPAPGPNARPRPAGVPLFGCLPLIIAQFAYRRNGDLRTRGGGPQSLPRKGLRSRAPPAADTARRSRCSGRRTQVCFSARSAMRAPQTGRWMRRKAQTEGCIAALRRRYPEKPGRGLPRIRRGQSPRQGPVLRALRSEAPPAGGNARIVPQPLQYRKPHAAGEIARPTKPPGAGGNAQTSAIRQARRRADAIIGPYAGDGAAGRRGKLPDAGAPSAVPRSAARLPCIVGRAFTPAGEP